MGHRKMHHASRSKESLRLTQSRREPDGSRTPSRLGAEGPSINLNVMRPRNSITNEEAVSRELRRRIQAEQTKSHKKMKITLPTMPWEDD